METMAKTTQTQAVTDAKTREMNVKAKMQALKDMSTHPIPVRNIVTGKPITTKNEAVKAPKKEAVISVTSLIDGIITKGGLWEDLVIKCNEATKGKGNIKYTASVLKAHVRYRTTLQKKADYLGQYVMTDEGIMPDKAKGKGKK